MKPTDKRLTPKPTENQLTILASVLARPAGDPIRQHAATVVAGNRSGNTASYDAVWRCVRRGWLKAKRAAQNRVEIYLTGAGVTALQPSSRAIVAAIGHALRYSEHRDDCDALEAIGYGSADFAADLDTDPEALLDRLTDSVDDDDTATWSAVADAIAHIAGRNP